MLMKMSTIPTSAYRAAHSANAKVIHTCHQPHE
jgi:hypothetical protein